MTTLLESVVHGFNKPYVRNYWNHTEGNKKVKRLEFISDPFLYQDANQVNRVASSSGLSNNAYGVYAAGKECVVRAPGASFHADNSTSLSQNSLFYSSTNGLDFTNVAVPTNSYQPTGLVFFNNKWFIFTNVKTLVSTDNTATTFVASTGAPPAKLYKPFVFANKILLTNLGGNSTFRSTTDGETFATHTLPVTGLIHGMATDGATLVILISSATGTWHIYKTTDLVTWTPMEARWTPTSSNVTGTGTSLTTSGFYPLGIVYTGSKFVIMATDVSISYLNSGEMSLLRSYVADNSSSPFILKGSFRLPQTLVGAYQTSGQATGSYMMRFYDTGYSRCSANHAMCMHNGRIFVAVGICFGTWVDVSVYKQHTLMMMESNDDGSTWTMLDIPPSTFTSATSDNVLLTSSMFSTPNGVVAYPMSTSGNTSVGYFKPNPGALELVVPYR